VLGEAVDVVIEGVECGCGQDAGLAHAAAQHLTNPPRLPYERLASGQGGADRRAQALAETDRDAVAMLAPLAGRGSRGDNGVPQAGAVQMHGQPVSPRPTADRVDLLLRIDLAASPVVRVLQAHQARQDLVVVFDRANLVFELAEIEDAAIAVEGTA